MVENGRVVRCHGFQTAEALRIEQHREERVDDAAPPPLLGRRDAAATAQEHRQQLRRQGQAIALVPGDRRAQGQQRALPAHRHGARIEARLARLVENAARRQPPPLGRRHPHLAEGHLAGRHVEQEGRAIGAAGKCDHQGIGPQAGSGAAGGGDGGVAVADIGEGQHDQTLLQSHLGIGADAADVVRVPDRQGHQAQLPRPGHGLQHGFADDPLAVAPVPGEAQYGAAVLHQPCRGVGPQGLLGDAGEIIRQHPDPMAVMAGEIGVHQVLGHQPRLGRRGERQPSAPPPTPPSGPSLKSVASIPPLRAHGS